MRILQLIGVIFCVAALACAQSFAQSPANAASAAGSDQARPSDRDDVSRRLTGIEDALGASLDSRLAQVGRVVATNLDTRLVAIEAKVAALSDDSLLDTLLPAILGVVGVLVGGLLTGYMEWRIARDQAKFEIGKSVVELQVKQLSLLYGPLRALLGQSKALYDQMNETLARTKPDKFRFLSGSGTEFQIVISGDWVRFRTVLHLSEVYGQGYGVETYFDEIVSIGARMVGIIEANAGYGRAEEKDLMKVFGQYLAHFALLKHLHEEAKARNTVARAGAVTSGVPDGATVVNISAVFPLELHDLGLEPRAHARPDTLERIYPSPPITRGSRLAAMGGADLAVLPRRRDSA